MTETEPQFDTAEGLYDEIDGLRAMLAIREQQIARLTAAARAAEADVWKMQMTLAGTEGYFCGACDAAEKDGKRQHRRWCTVGALAALLDGDP